MGKRNNKKLQADAGNIGCMWGLIRMIHFRRDPKMILDQREGGRQYLINRFSKGITSGEINEINEEDSDADQSNSKPTVKKLMEKEMNRSKIGKTKIPSDEIDKILSDWGHKIEPDNKKSKKRRPKPHSNQKPKSISDSNTNTSSTENSDLEIVIASFLVEIYRYHNECQLCKNKKGLCPTLRSIVYSKLNDLSTAPEHGTTIGERHLSNTGVCESKEFMNALEILGSNKELFLKILQDPDSHVLEKVQEITEKRDTKRFSRRKEEEKVQGINERRDTKWFSRRKEEDEKDQLINEKRDVKRFLGRKDEEDKTNISPSASKIVVLKPKSTAKPSYDAKAVSHFSFREIKKRLRQIIGETAKERTERTDPYLFKVVTGMNKPYRPVRTAVGSSFYEEAKKHLMDILRTGNEPDNATGEHASVPLGKILSLARNNLELDSAQKVGKDDNDIKSVYLTKEGLESIVSIKEYNEENIIKNENTKPETQLEACCEEMTTKETVNTIEIKIEDSTESIPVVDAPVEATSGECTILSETSKEDPVPGLAEEFKQAEEELIEEPIFVISDSVENSIIERSDCHSPEPSTSYSCKESYCEKTDQPSPISVLEPTFADDAPSPNCTNTDHDKLHRCLWPAWPNQTSLLEDASARSEFIESVLESSELCKEENLERWHQEEELLDPSLFDQLDISPNQIDDFRLLFDCICEVLTEIQHKYFRFSQQMPVRKRNLLQEVCQGVSWHLRHKHPFLLDHVIRSDLDCGSWCDLREETESIVVEMWDEFIDDLLEETVFDLWL